MADGREPPADTDVGLRGDGGAAAALVIAVVEGAEGSARSFVSAPHGR